MASEAFPPGPPSAPKMLAFDGTSSLCPFSFTDPRLYSLKKIVAQRDFTSRPIRSPRSRPRPSPYTPLRELRPSHNHLPCLAPIGDPASLHLSVPLICTAIPLHHPESPRIKTEKVASIYLSTPPRTPSVRSSPSTSCSLQRSLALENTIKPPADEQHQRWNDSLLRYLTHLCDHPETTNSAGQRIQLTASRRETRADDDGVHTCKLRISPFVAGFAEWLESERRTTSPTPGLPRLRKFLWFHPCICRFNSRGRKVWTIGSRLSNDGTRTFHHFTRSITITGLPTSPASFAPAPPSSSSPLAVVVSPNSFWAFTPSLWDPHVSLLGSRQSFSSPTGTLPAWLSWNEGSLTGVPPQDAVGKTWEVTIVGTLEGKDKGDVESIERTLALEVREARGAAPVAA